ncbi:putative DNA-(apurinic or apyrimidinic site) lyase [Helianthus anomalus]
MDIERESGSENQFNTSLLMDSVWTSIPCIDLLALADAALTPNTPNQMPNSQAGGVRYLFDLNSPPEPQLVTSISSPKQTRKAVRKRVMSEILNSKTDAAVNLEQFKPITEQSEDEIWQLEVNEEDSEEEESIVDFSLQNTPQPKPKRRKHRPKVVIEGQSKKSTTPKSKTSSSTGNRKNITPEKPTVRPVRNSCRRKIYFEDEWVYDSLSPITPNKSEIATGAKDTCSRARRNLKFSKTAHEKEASSLNGSTCSSSSSEEDASLEAADITNFPAIFKKKRTEKCYNNSIAPKAISSKWSHEMSTVLDDVEICRKKRSKGRKRAREMGSFARLFEGKSKSKSPWVCMEALAAADYSLNVSTKKRTKRNYYTMLSSSYQYHWSLTDHIGFHSRWRSRYDTDALINQFETLCINNQTVEPEPDQHALVPYLTRYRERNGLVLYNQHHRDLVPYEDSDDGAKIRQLRPKVDLDDETSRVWRLLLEDINSEGVDGTDEDNTKFWEEERNVFSGRAASFIARMHLVQGDRRFSRWKGSVVDSVIGVFLTQNVSDHLSSSAFMNLAARYPLAPKSGNEEAFEEENSSISVKLDVEKTITCHEDEEKEVEDLVSSGPNTAQSSISDTSVERLGSWLVTNSLTNVNNDSGHITDNKHEHKCASEQSEISAENQQKEISEVTESNSNEHGNFKVKKGKNGKAKKTKRDWDSMRKTAELKNKRERSGNAMDSLDYEAVRRADVNEISDVIKDRGMNNMLAQRIKEFLNRLVRDHGSIDLEWLRDVPPDRAKEYLLSFRGLGLKSVECVRLLTLHHLAFPVDTNVGRIAVRLGWVPLQPLPESLQLHLLELYPILESIQKYLWPRLCKLDQRTLYELHYQMITFGKVFCTKNKPNCNSCPMRGECRHFASAFASSRLALPAPEEKRIVTANKSHGQSQSHTNQHTLTLPPADHHEYEDHNRDPIIEVPASPEPIIEVPATPEAEKIQEEFDIEDFCEEIPIIRLNMEAFTQNVQNYMQNNMEVAESDMSKALVALTSEAASIPTPKLKNVSQLRTEHQVYELPDSHPLLEGLDKREPDDPCSYLLAIWTPGETAESIQPPKGQCSSSQESGTLCRKKTCFWCNSVREANSQTVRGTLLIPCRTAMRGSFPLNGTYFQVNEVFADHESSLCPIDVPRCWLWNLPRRTVYFGTSIPTIFRGLTTQGIQHCFWRGFVCVRGFDQKTRAPRPLMARLHFPASKLKASSKLHS